MVRLLVCVLVLMAASVYGARFLAEGGHQAGAHEQTPKSNAARMVVIKSEHGQFTTDARVDGRHISFMVDTGASAIAIRASDAERVGYRPAAREYTIRIETANGEGRAAPIELSTVEVGDILVRHVRAFVVPDAALSTNLLGMSFLSRVRFSHERGAMILEQ